MEPPVAGSADGEAPRVTLVTGSLAGLPGAHELASEVAALMHRYAAEVVAAHRLCPFLDDVQSGLGAVVVVLDRTLDVSLTVKAVRTTESRVVHCIFPCLPDDSAAFERFGNEVATQLRRDGGPPIVHAVFHPSMVGGDENPHRFARLVRRSPDAFLQFIPDGIQQGGTTYAGTPMSAPSPLDATFARLQGPALTEVVALMAALRVERLRRYAPFAERFGPFA